MRMKLLRPARRTLKMPEFLLEMLAQHLSEFGSPKWTFPAPEGGFLRYDNYLATVAPGR